MSRVRIELISEASLLDAIQSISEQTSDQEAIIWALQKVVAEHEEQAGRPAGLPLSAHMDGDELMVDPAPVQGREPVED